MEVSALFAVAQHRGVSCAAILAISDELYEPWRIGFQTEEFQRAMVRCGLAALEAARGGAG
jgi:purine-nucleoside phosphorylase